MDFYGPVSDCGEIYQMVSRPDIHGTEHGVPTFMNPSKHISGSCATSRRREKGKRKSHQFSHRNQAARHAVEHPAPAKHRHPSYSGTEVGRGAYR